MLERFVALVRSLDPDLREAFLQKLRVRWSHTSTALEGNTLDEGETLGVLQYGVTVAGKPLAHHNEVLGHARAVDLLYAIVAQDRPLAEADLHALHTAVQTSVEMDALKPVGAWKREPNATLARREGKTIINDTYAAPADVPELMRSWLAGFEQRRRDPAVSALDAHAWGHATWVRIHPYADGNGRMARLVANIPVIEKGSLPFLIPQEDRLAAFDALAAWQMASGPVRPGKDLAGDATLMAVFQGLCAGWMRGSEALLDEVRALQERRARKGG